MGDILVIVFFFDWIFDFYWYDESLIVIKWCFWVGDDLIYIDYYDMEWGVLEWDDRVLFEKLIFDGF